LAIVAEIVVNEPVHAPATTRWLFHAGLATPPTFQVI
jgi:hypothetical protein